MSLTDHFSCLPNEIITLILDHLPLPCLLKLTIVSRTIHHITLLHLHARLRSVPSSAADSLLLEAYHPSARLVALPLFCSHVGTEGLEDKLRYKFGEEVGQLDKLGNLYSRFRPGRYEERERRRRRRRKHPAGDVRGSRTWREPVEEGAREGSVVDEVGREHVTLDAGELFSQVCVLVNLVKHSGLWSDKRVITSIVEVSDGTIRIWRDWLAKNEEAMRGKREEEGEGDARVLWVNNCGRNVGIKFRIKEEKTRDKRPVLYGEGDAVAVSYCLEFEELLVRTTYLLDKIEKSRGQQKDVGGRAIIFGTFAEA